jgi:hypothetical protein
MDCGSAIHDSRGAVRNPVSLVGDKKMRYLSLRSLRLRKVDAESQRTASRRVAISKSAVHDCRGAVRNPVSSVGVKNCDVECGETGFLRLGVAGCG